jgi:hypothetical protein
MKILVQIAWDHCRSLGVAHQRGLLKRVASQLLEIEELLMGGLVPTSAHWVSIQALPDPWGPLASESLSGLRANGGALLPTLRRLRVLVQDQDQSIATAQSKVSQAFAQALVCMSLVPILGISLDWMLAAVHSHLKSWLLLVGLAMAFSALGGFWLLNMTENARWGGLRKENQSWLLIALCAGERFLALVRTGQPPDLAWIRICELLGKEARPLAEQWGFSVWDICMVSSSYRPAERSLCAVGTAMKKAIQVSLMEGRPCLEKVETILAGLRSEMKVHVDRELTLLSTRALKPLFLCVAPGLFCLLFYSLWLVFMDTTQASFNELWE